METRVLKFSRLKVALCNRVVIFVYHDSLANLDAIFEHTLKLILVFKFLNTKAICFTILKPALDKVLSIVTTEYVISNRRGNNPAVLTVKFAIQKRAMRYRILFFVDHHAKRIWRTSFLTNKTLIVNVRLVHHWSKLLEILVSVNLADN